MPRSNRSALVRFEAIAFRPPTILAFATALALMGGCPATTNTDSNLTAPGPAGPQGPAGTAGAQGEAGLDCWDTNGNGVGDPGEDVNGDGLFNSLDCQGAVPSGNFILGNSSTPPAGYSFTGLAFDAGENWTTRADSPIPRAAAAAVTMPDGIYVAGGVDPNVSLPIADVSRYDPNTNTWSAVPGMPTKRYFPAAGAIHGKMIVAGGFDSTTPVVAVTEQFDPATNGWTTLAPMTTPVWAVMSATANNKLYVFGGLDTANDAVNNVQIYDPASNTWTPGATMPTKRAAGYCGLVNGKIYVCGGTDNNVIFDALESYDPVANTWTTLPPMPRALAIGASTAVGGKLYVIGGVDGITPNLSVADLVMAFDPVAGTWTSHTPPSGPSLYATAVAINGKVELIGGVTLASVVSRNNELYTPPATLFVFEKN